MIKPTQQILAALIKGIAEGLGYEFDVQRLQFGDGRALYFSPTWPCHTLIKLDQEPNGRVRAYPSRTHTELSFNEYMLLQRVFELADPQLLDKLVDYYKIELAQTTHD